MWYSLVSIVPIIGRAIGSLLVWSPVPRLAEAAGWSYEIPWGPRRRGSGAVTVITHTHHAQRRPRPRRRSSSFRNISLSCCRLDLQRIYHFFKPSKFSPCSYGTELIVRNNWNCESTKNDARVFTNEIDNCNLWLVFHWISLNYYLWERLFPSYINSND